MERGLDDPATGEAPPCRAPAQEGAQARGRIPEEPCARKPARTVLQQRRGERFPRLLSPDGGPAARCGSVAQSQVGGPAPAAECGRSGLRWRVLPEGITLVIL
jgi:hypothetical protein